MTKELVSLLRIFGLCHAMVAQNCNEHWAKQEANRGSWEDLKLCMRARFVPPHSRKELLLKL